MRKKVAVAMSGGVDSGVAAALLVKRGYQVAGFYMKLWQEEKDGDKNFEDSGMKTGQKTARKLGMPFYIVDLKKNFKRKVVDYFLREYGLGRTPNPCVICNKCIKFGELFNYVGNLGYDYLATGHYARVKLTKSGFFCLLTGKDRMKDQSYFLYNLSQKQLAKVIFPVGDYLKKEIRAMARRWKLPVVESPESREICFLGGEDYRSFLKRHIPEKILPGEVIDTGGRVIGRHFGLPLYTIGQRCGFEIRVKREIIPPYYVIGKNMEKNQLIVGFGKEAEKEEFFVGKVNWINPLISSQLARGNLRCKVKIRHRGEFLDCEVKSEEIGKKIKVRLASPERGVAQGQMAVFYQREKVIGGGIIEEIGRNN